MLFFALIGVQRLTVPFWARARESSAALFGFIEERLSGTEDIRSGGAIDYTMNGCTSAGATGCSTSAAPPSSAP